ncbi:MAG TPA: cytochrome c biogenesis protein CcsA [Rhodothermales bacterium]|nr:cytochrome c biogenesis protein CcsA [Rhodothermales bacterium]
MTIGTIGYLMLTIAFVAGLLSAVSYFFATRASNNLHWRTTGRWSWVVMTGALLISTGLLLYLLATHQFQYSYVFRYSSKDLNLNYLLSALWAGQEGSFLIWLLWTAILGLLLMRNTRSYEPYVMSIIGLCQIFLLAMVTGFKFGTFQIGASPFITTADAFPEAPVLQTPGFIPSDGQGLNDLLQNYWMMIHPPTLFIGFTLMIVPFAFAIAGLWRREYTQWVKPALPWTIMANLILMVGIAMGGYWAYVTLSFGGYWAWDPVENASLVPWLIGVAGLHTMIAQKRSASSQKASIFLNILAFILVVYSTFLTRSGILGEISVHSFVDLGLYNQLLLWILAMALLGFGMMAYRWKELPRPQHESEVMSREFMIFSGAMVLAALAAVIILGTSAPITGRLFRDSPSAVPIEFYDAWSLPLAIILAFLAGVGQLFWWHKMKVESLNRVLMKPMLLAVVATSAVLLLTPFVRETVRPVQAAVQSVSQAGMLANLGMIWDQYGQSLLLMLLVFTSFFALFGNGMVLWRIGRGNPRLVGGAVTHIGLALMLLGIITSSSFNNAIVGDENNSVPIEGSTQRNNFVINRNQTIQVEGYKVRYVKHFTNNDGHTTYQLEMTDARGRKFTVFPVAYKSRKNQWILHPDIKPFFEKDIYVAVTPSQSVLENQEGGNKTAGELKMAMGDTKTIDKGKYIIRFQRFDLQPDPKIVGNAKTQIAVASVLSVTNTQTKETRELKPIYMILDDGKNTQQYIQNKVADWGVTFTFAGMELSKDGKNGQIRLVLEGADVTSAEDWLIVQAYEKPFINLLWLGCLILFAGFGIAYYRRWKEQSERNEMGRNISE